MLVVATPARKHPVTELLVDGSQVADPIARDSFILKRTRRARALTRYPGVNPEPVTSRADVSSRRRRGSLDEVGIGLPLLLE